MSAMLASVLFLAPFAQQPQPDGHAQEVTLDALIERSRSIRSFSAVYAMTQSNEDSSATMRLEFQAPDKFRMDAEHEEEHVSSWVHGTVVDMRVSSPTQPCHGHFDLESIDRELEPLTQALELAFPSPNPPTHGSIGGLVARWSYDPAKDELDFNLTMGRCGNVDTPLGWLATLKDKGIEPVVDGERLRFSTDGGHFDVVVSRSNGFLEEVVGRKKDKAVTLKLLSLALDEPIDAQRFEVPPAAEGSTDFFAGARPAMEQGERESLRTRLYTRAAESCATAEVEPALRAKFESVMRPLREAMCRARFDAWLVKLREGIDSFGERVRQAHEAGTADDEIDQNVDQYEREMIEHFDESEAKYTDTLELPARAATAGCAPRLLAIERELCASAFRAVVRQPIVDELEHAIEVARR